jgi:hypothetical protein
MSTRLTAGLIGLAVVVAPALGRGEDAPQPKPTSEAAAEPAAPRAPVDLDRLLRLPDSIQYDMEKKGGLGRGEWRARFREARQDLEGARAALARSQAELEKVADGGQGGAWNFTPPGVNADTSDAPLDYRLRMEIKKQREEVEGAEKRLLDLEVEADLAGVPEDWRQ